MNINNAQFVCSAVKPSQYPEGDLQEIAVAGRSNAGKSSLINSLLNRKNLARTGSTPGMTRLINYYNVDDTLFLVDLPGYGYAKVSKTEKQEWAEIAQTYFNTRSQLKLVLLLMDIRHIPSENDIIMLEYLRHKKMPYVIVATKSDKLSKSAVKLSLADMAKQLELNYSEMPIAFSSTEKTGIDEIWKEIKNSVNFI